MSLLLGSHLHVPSRGLIDEDEEDAVDVGDAAPVGDSVYVDDAIEVGRHFYKNKWFTVNTLFFIVHTLLLCFFEELRLPIYEFHEDLN